MSAYQTAMSISKITSIFKTTAIVFILTVRLKEVLCTLMIVFNLDVLSVSLLSVCSSNHSLFVAGVFGIGVA